MLKTLRKLSEIGSLAKPTQWMISFFGGGLSNSKIQITHDTALGISAVYACVYALSDDVSKLPIRVYRRDAKNGDETELRQHPIASLLRRPNPLMTGKVFREVMQHALVLWGNAFAEIVFDGAGRPIGLYPIEPWRVTIEVTPDSRVIYHAHNNNGVDAKLEPSQVLHLKLLSKDGIKGISVLQAAREAMGISISAERAQAELYGRGMMPAGVLSHPGKLSEAAQKNLRESLERRYGGAENAGKPMVLQEGMVWTTIGMPMKDAQFVEARQFTLPEICRFFRVPAHIAGDLSRSTNNNIEHQSLEYAQYTLLGHARRWEEEIEMKLAPYFPGGEDLNVEHDMDELLRGDIKSRGEYYQRGRQWGWLTGNDVRRSEKLPAFAAVDGDQVLVPVNMTTPARIAAGQTQLDQPSPDAPTEPTPSPDPQLEDLARGVVSMAIAGHLRSSCVTEADKVTRAARQGTLPALVADWYPRQVAHLEGEIAGALARIAPVISALGVPMTRGQAETLAAAAAKKHCDRSLREASDADEVAAWSKGRAATAADELAGDIVTALLRRSP